MADYFITILRALYFLAAMALLVMAAFVPVFMFWPWYWSVAFYWAVFTVIYLDLKAPQWGPTAIFHNVDKKIEKGVGHD